MPCFGPITAYYSAVVNPRTGLRPLVFRKDQSHSGIPMQVPCGQCIGCKLERSRQWALRCLHEMKLHQESAFVTLTYEDRHLPPYGSLVKADLQLFMKRLRKVRPPGIRFFACGEYGTSTNRPHYHVLFLNTSFPDMKKRSWGSSETEHDTFVSAELSTLWRFGGNVIGRVTFESCCYVARYCTKVITGPPSFDRYRDREREFAVMSRRPGIGLLWFDKYNAEWYRHDSLIVDGNSVPIPRYYDSKRKVQAIVSNGKLFSDFEVIKSSRRRKAIAAADDNTQRRLMVKERLAKQSLKFFAKDRL